MPLSRKTIGTYRTHIGWMPQDIPVIPGFTVHESVSYHAWLGKVPEPQMDESCSTMSWYCMKAECCGRVLWRTISASLEARLRPRHMTPSTSSSTGRRLTDEWPRERSRTPACAKLLGTCRRCEKGRCSNTPTPIRIGASGASCCRQWYGGWPAWPSCKASARGMRSGAHVYRVGGAVHRGVGGGACYWTPIPISRRPRSMDAA